MLALATRRPLGQRHIGQLRHLAGQLKARILLLPLVSGPAAVVTRPEALVRAVLAAARQLPDSTLVVPVPLPPRANPDEELAALVVIAAAHGATHLLTDAGGRTDAAAKLGVEVLTEPEWAYDPAAEVWRPLGLIAPGTERGELSGAELGELLDAGGPVPVVADAGGRNRGAAQGAAAAVRARHRRVLHRAVRVRQVHPRPRPA